MTATPRTKAAAVHILGHLQKHPGALSDELEKIARRHRIPLDDALRYMAERGRQTISRYDGQHHRRYLIRHADDILDRNRQRQNRNFAELRRQTRAARALSTRYPTDRTLTEAADALTYEALTLGHQLGLRVDEVYADLEPSDKVLMPPA